MERKFWEVEFTGTNTPIDTLAYYVFANSAAEAEKKALVFALKDFKDYVNPGKVYCTSAKYTGRLRS